MGSNVGKKDNEKKYALYYGLKNKSVEIVKILLQYGAHPWSTQNCSIKKMMEQANNKQINLLLSNARKIFLGVRLQINNKKRS